MTKMMSSLIFLLSYFLSWLAGWFHGMTTRIVGPPARNGFSGGVRSADRILGQIGFPVKFW